MQHPLDKNRLYIEIEKHSVIADSQSVRRLVIGEFLDVADESFLKSLDPLENSIGVLYGQSTEIL